MATKSIVSIKQAEQAQQSIKSEKKLTSEHEQSKQTSSLAEDLITPSTLETILSELRTELESSNK